MERSSFVFYKDWKEAIKGLPDDIRLEIYDSITGYAFGDNIEGLKPMAAIAFNFMKTTIDRDIERYMSIAERNRNNGKNGGRPKKPKITQNNPNNPVGFLETQNNPNNPDGNIVITINDAINNNIKEKPTIVGKKKNPDGFTPAQILDKRKKKFMDDCAKFVDIYGREMVRAFFDYWTEPNKSLTKMRFELEQTWDLKRRFTTWANNEGKFNKTAKTEEQPKVAYV